MHQFIIPFTIMLSIFGSGLYYVAQRLGRWIYLLMTKYQSSSLKSQACMLDLLKGGWLTQNKIALVIGIVFIGSIVLAFLPFPLSLKKVFVWFAWILVGFYIYFLLSFLLADLVIFIGKVFRFISLDKAGSPLAPPSEMGVNLISIHLVAGWIVIGLVILIVSFGVYNGRQIRNVAYDVVLKAESGVLSDHSQHSTLNTQLSTLKIALIADLHLWHINDHKYLAKVVDKINALDVDLVVMAGDIFNDSYKAIAKPDEVARLFRSIQSKYGVYAALGNHDGGSGFAQLTNLLSEGNVNLLVDKYVVIDDKFILLGRQDGSPIGYQGEKRKELFEVLGVESGVLSDTGELEKPKEHLTLDTKLSTLPIIVIDHNPAHIYEYIGIADLVLSGHTHRGQLIPGTLITNLVYKSHYGLTHFITSDQVAGGRSQVAVGGESALSKKADQTHMIVTSGVGTWGPPLRVGSSNEIALIEVRSEK